VLNNFFGYAKKYRNCSYQHVGKTKTSFFNHFFFFFKEAPSAEALQQAMAGLTHKDGPKDGVGAAAFVSEAQQLWTHICSTGCSQGRYCSKSSIERYQIQYRCIGVCNAYGSLK
jgi:hypothetical protein